MNKEVYVADYQRARSPQQKAERMSAIMDATETLFAQLPYHEINMGLIAKNWAGHALISTNMPQPKKRYSLRSIVALIVLWSMILWLRLQARSSRMPNLRMSGHVPLRAIQNSCAIKAS